MIIKNLDTSKKVFIVAEIGNNHEGSFANAKKMISAAADTGVDAVKFQTIVPELFVNIEDKDRFNKLKEFQLTYNNYEKLALYAEKKGLYFCSTPFDLESAKFLNNIQSFFKISSGDNEFYPLLEQVCKFNKPIILSTGLIDIKKIKKIVKFIYHNNNNQKNKLALLHCISSYPTKIDKINLNSIKFLKKNFKDTSIGFSDHTLGIEAAALSVVCGAEIIEKHFTLDKNFSNFRDHKISSDPKEMKKLVNKIREIETILGNEEKIVNVSEKKSIIDYKRSIAVKRNLKKGHKVKISDLIWVRPGNGLSPGKENLVINKILKKNISARTILKKNYFYK